MFNVHGSSFTKKSPESTNAGQSKFVVAIFVNRYCSDITADSAIPALVN